MPTEMKDEGKGGEDRVKEMKKEQQEKMEKKDAEKPGEYPKPEEQRDEDVPPGT